ncbi:MAG TPA: GNAT family N-acetyltransferase, partial [Nonomuraea sp.]|nr:GNAT family N-acetyltransferase [Nonomuraea sp.]
MPSYLETDRLTLRRFADSDADDLFALHNDPDVMRYLNGGRPTPREVIVEETLPRFVGPGFLAALERPSGAFVGWFHLRP